MLIRLKCSDSDINRFDSSVITVIPRAFQSAGRWSRLLTVVTCSTCFSLLAGSFFSLYAAEPIEIRITGIEGDPYTNISAALAPPEGLMRDGVIDRLWLEYYASHAEEKARTALEPFGYYRPRITVRLTANPREFTLDVAVEPGNPVRLAGVSVSAAGPGANEEIVKSAVAGFPLRTGDVLLHQLYEAGKAKLLAQLLSLGYLDAEFTRHEIEITPDADTAWIELLLQTGPRYQFGATSFEGAPLYSADLLSRYLAFKPGAPFSYDLLGQTQANLVGSGYFVEATILPRKEEAADLAIPVLISLKPAPARTIRPGIGYGTDTGFRGSLSYKELNLFRLGHVLTIEGTAAEKFQGIGAGYTIPDAESLRTMTGFQVNLQREDVTTYQSTVGAFELNRTVNFGKGRIGTAYLKLQHEQFTIARQDTYAHLVMPGLRFSGRQYDNLVRPANGYSYSLELRGTDQVLGSDTGFIQGIAEGAYLLPLTWKFSLSTRAKAGATWQDDPIADLPASLRFFAGGDNSVRGYAYKSLGPKNSTGEVIGGRHLLQGSIELERSLFDSWGISLFYDAGNAFKSFNDLRLAQGAGVGLHYYTKIGGVNLSVARRIGVDDPGFRIHFTIGYQP